MGRLGHPHGHRNHSLIEMVELSALGSFLLLSKWTLPRTSRELALRRHTERHCPLAKWLCLCIDDAVLIHRVSKPLQDESHASSDRSKS